MIEKYKKLPLQIKASLWFLICSFLQKAVSVITTPIFTRLLSTSEYGKVSVFISWQGIIVIFVCLNLYSGVYNQGLVKFEDERKIYASSMQGLSAVLVLAWLIVYLLWENFWNGLFSLSTLQMISMFVIIWSNAAYEFWAAEQRVEYKYKTLVIITLAVSVVSPVIGIWLVSTANDKATAKIVGLAIVGFVFYFPLFLKQMINGKAFFSKKYWLYALTFNIPLIPHYLSQTVLNSSDRIMIKELVGDDRAGIYNLAYSLSMIMLLFNTALMQTVTPWMFTKIKNKQIADLKKICYPLLMLVAFINILLIAFAPEAVAIFAPESYYEAIWVIPPIAMSVYFIFTYEMTSKFAFYYEKTKLIAPATVISAVLNIILNYIFIRIFGYYAAGYTTLVCYMIYSATHYYLMVRICREEYGKKRPYDLKVIILISGVFIIFGFFFLFLYNYIMLRYATILLILVVGIMRRKMIINFIKELISLKKQQEQ